MAPKSHRIAVRLTVEGMERLIAIADRRHTSRSWAARLAARTWLEQYRAGNCLYGPVRARGEGRAPEVSAVLPSEEWAELSEAVAEAGISANRAISGGIDYLYGRDRESSYPDAGDPAKVSMRIDFFPELFPEGSFEHRGWWGNPNVEGAFHTPAEIDAYIERGAAGMLEALDDEEHTGTLPKLPAASEARLTAAHAIWCARMAAAGEMEGVPAQTDSPGYRQLAALGEGRGVPPVYDVSDVIRYYPDPRDWDDPVSTFVAILRRLTILRLYIGDEMDMASERKRRNLAIEVRTISRTALGACWDACRGSMPGTPRCYDGDGPVPVDGDGLPDPRGMASPAADFAQLHKGLERLVDALETPCTAPAVQVDGHGIEADSPTWSSEPGRSGSDVDLPLDRRDAGTESD